MSRTGRFNMNKATWITRARKLVLEKTTNQIHTPTPALRYHAPSATFPRKSICMPWIMVWNLQSSPPKTPVHPDALFIRDLAVIIVVIWRCRSNISLPSPELSICFSRSSESDYHGILGLVKPPRLLAWEHWRRAARGSRGRFRILP